VTNAERVCAQIMLNQEDNARVFSSEVDAGSRQENASAKK
jgi:hypothetical protein